MRRISFRFSSYRFEILNKPSLWMSPDSVQALQERLKTVARARFSADPNYSYFSDSEHFKNKVIVVLSDAKSKKDLAFCAMCELGTYKGSPVVHLGSVFSAAENKGALHLLYTFGLSFIFLTKKVLKDLYVTSLTHTPKIFGVVADTFFDVYPNQNPAAQAEDFHLALKDMLINEYIIPEWSLASGLPSANGFVMEGLRRQADGSILFPDDRESVPKHRKSAYNNVCLDLLDYDRGDEVLQVGRINFVRGLTHKILERARLAF